MKHIKLFNETKDNEDDLKDFCEINLAYLLDNEDFKLNVDYFHDHTQGGTYRGQIRLENNNEFKWDDIKDYFIPFLIQLDKIRGHQIKIGDEKLIFVHRYRGNWHKVKFDDLVNDRLDVLSGPYPMIIWDKIHIELRD